MYYLLCIVIVIAVVVMMFVVAVIQVPHLYDLLQTIEKDTSTVALCSKSQQSPSAASRDLTISCQSCQMKSSRLHNKACMQLTLQVLHLLVTQIIAFRHLHQPSQE